MKKSSLEILHDGELKKIYFLYENKTLSQCQIKKQLFKPKR
jgi:hypothetical protein